MKMYRVTHWSQDRFFHTHEEAEDMIREAVDRNVDWNLANPDLVRGRRPTTEDGFYAEYTITEVERDSNPCKTCGQEVQAKDPVAYPYCKDCHYTGRAANDRQAGEIAAFRTALPDADVRVEHTGGGCFWLAFYWEGEPVSYAATSGEASLPEDGQWADGWGAIFRYAEDTEGDEVLPVREAYLDEVQGYTVAEVVAAISADRKERGL